MSLGSFLRAVVLGFAVSASAQSWTHMGPFKTAMTAQDPYESGRVDTICLDPSYTGINVGNQNTIYIGSRSGGLYITSDGGGHWANVDLSNTGTNMKYGGVSALAIENTVNGWLYLADHNAVGCSGVYKHHAPNTWSNTGPFPGVVQPFVVNKLAVHTADDSVVFAGTNQGLFRSANSGATWSLIASANGDIKNVVFMPRSGGTGAYPYYVYAAGRNAFLVSGDDGVSFGAVLAVQSLFSNYQSVYANIAYSASNTVPGDQYVYIHAYTEDLNQVQRYCLFRYAYNSTSGVEGAMPVGSCYQEYDNTPDRLAIAANDQSVYYGAVQVRKYSVTHGQESGPSYGHADQHELYFHAPTRTLFLANDGGFCSGKFTPSHNPDDGAGATNLSKKNTGLNISQIVGLSGSAQDADIFLTQENDTGGFYNSVSNGTQYKFSGEAAQVLFDRDYANTYYYQAQYSIPGVHIHDQPLSSSTAQSYSQSNRYDPNAAAFCGTDTLLAGESLNSLFGLNTIFQDPNRPGKVFFGLKQPPSLNEYCPGNHRFETKYVPSQCLPSVSWQQSVNAIGFSASDKNKTYLTTTNFYWPPNSNSTYAASVLRYNGSDIDQGWATNSNPCDWVEITPPLAFFQSLNSAVTQADWYKIWYPGIAISDWDGDRLWLIVSSSSIFNGNIDFHLAFTSLISSKVLSYTHGTWTDFTQGIPSDELPYSIVYEKGTNDGMYLGTNRAVYYRDATMSSWQPYSAGLPVAIISQMEINYNDNTLRAGTYGYGARKTALSCPTNATLLSSGVVASDLFAEARVSVTVQNQTVSNGYARYRSTGHVDFLPSTSITASHTCKAFAFIHGCTTPGNSF